MRTLLMRNRLPDRRRSWTQEVTIEGQVIFLDVGEYSDGSPGEIFVDVSKAGTFLNGIMGAWARTASIALQCGANIEMIIYSIEGLDFPPHGDVKGSEYVSQCKSVVDWIAQELKQKYLTTSEDEIVKPSIGEGDPISPLVEKPVPKHHSKNVWA